MNSSQFLEVFVSLSFQASMLVIVAHGMSARCTNARTQTRLWNACTFALLGLTAIAAVMPHLRLLHPWSGLSFNVAARVAVFQSNLGMSVLLVWGIGATGSMLLLALEWWRTARFLKGCRPGELSRAPLGDVFEEIRRESGEIAGPVRILTSPEIRTPFCWQFHQPFIVLPDSFLSRSSSELKFVIRHELEHLRTGHPVQLFLQRLVEILYWFHPMVWSVSRQSELAREFACDDAAVGSRRDIAAYLRLLVAVAEQGEAGDVRPGNELAFGRGASMMARRGRRLLERSRCGPSPPSGNRDFLVQTTIAAAALSVSLLWAPVDVLASSRVRWSPWPKWSARALFTFDVPVRDFEPPEDRSRLFELQEDGSRPGLR